MKVADLVSVAALGALQAALVGLPKADALARLERLRSRAWAATLPGMIVVGTLLVLVMPSAARELIGLAAVSVMPLTLIGVVAVVRARRTLLVLVPIALALSFLPGAPGDLFASVLTALGCLTLGVALARLTPPRWFPVGLVAMCAADLSLFAVGAGQASWGLMAQATAHAHGPVFDQVKIGTMTIDYPDLVVAAALGGIAAQWHLQRQAAALTAALSATLGLAVLSVHLLPATVPVGLSFVLLRRRSARGQPARSGRRDRVADGGRAWAMSQDAEAPARRTSLGLVVSPCGVRPRTDPRLRPGHGNPRPSPGAMCRASRYAPGALRRSPLA
ncbi:MAG: hypothetical protein ACYCXW_24050 [Solirubrobacteraceae bacterium]